MYILNSLSKKEIDNIIKSFKKEIVSGVYISVQITDRTIEIRSQIADFNLIFNNYIISPGELSNNAFELQFVGMSDRLTSKINEDEKLMIGIWTVITQVIGILIYLQMPNKVNSAKKHQNFKSLVINLKRKQNNIRKLIYIKQHII